MKPSQLNPRAVITNPLALVLGYAVFGALWILLSDRAVEWLLHDPALVAIANTLKGWAFIALTSLLLYMMMRNWMGPAGDPPAPVSRHSLWPPVTLACVVIAGLTAVAIGYNFSRHKQTEVARLQSIADLKAWQIKAWLEERQGDVAFLQSSRLLTELYRNWRERGDSASRDRLLERFGQFGMSKGYEKVVLLDEQGEPLRGSSGQTPGVAPELLNDARQAVASGESPLIVSLGTANGELDLNFAASLPVPGGGPSPIIILNVNPAGYLTPLLQKWPVPSSSAETLLFRRRGDQVLYLNRLRHEPDAQGLLRLPIATKSLLAAQVLRGEIKPGSAFEGLDYRGVPAVGAVRAIPGTDWFLLAKLDRGEIFAQAWRDFLWIVLAGLLAIFTTIAGAMILRQRWYMVEIRREHQIQTEKLRALQTLAALAKGTADVMFIKDMHGRYLLFNRAACELFSKAEQDVLGKECSDLFPPEEAAMLTAADQEVMTNRRTLTRELCLTTANGLLTLRTTLGPLLDAKGELNGVFGVARDVTESKRSTESLRMLSMAVEQSPESIVITDIDARLVYVNEAFVRNTGYSREEALGKNPRILQSGRTPPETFESMWADLSQGKPWKGVLFNRRKDGSDYVEFVIITPIHEADGRVTHFVAVKEDITEKQRLGKELDQHRHHLEELVDSRTAQLVEARQLADIANRAKSAFLANMSHEIRTPMNAIVGLTHILRQARPTPEQAGKLERIAVAAAHLLSIVNDILDLSKIESGKLDLEQTDFSLASILDHTRSLIFELAQAKGLALSVEADGVPQWLRGDPTRLRQALLNFASNAVKFTEWGAITLRARLLEDHGDQVRIRFEVEDTGIGIAADDLSVLFQPFAQADVATTRNYGGTGLGLAISRRLVELMGGEMGVESEVGRGSKFWFSICFERGTGVLHAEPDVADTTDSAEDELRQHHGGWHLLLVEDNPVNREVALELIHAAGITADSAADGVEAVAMASSKHYDLILMDMQMPRMNGLDATRAIRSLPSGVATPILAMTANALNENRQACLDVGMNDFVSKPVDPQLLYAMLSKWLPRKALEAPVTIVATEAAAAPISDDAKLFQRLADIPGLDVDVGLSLMRGKVNKYSRLLVMFVVGYEQYAAQISAMVAFGDLDTIKPIAYSLKGTASMLGASDVTTSVEALISALDGGAGTEVLGSLCTSLTDDLSSLVNKIRLATAGNIDPARAGADSRCLAVLTRLAELLDEGNLEASYLAWNEFGLLQAALGDSARELLARIEAFDYDNAASELRQFLAHPHGAQKALSVSESIC
ncbi:MAG: PAS domain S-box protein [Candidatus Accumulibacter sp.]|nr:PAS domain S-box protein [Candidatus Accumulibacter necessarius]